MKLRSDLPNEKGYGRQNFTVGEGAFPLSIEHWRFTIRTHTDLQM